MNCICLKKRDIASFKDWQDYFQFAESLEHSESLKEIPVSCLYADVGLIETWFECTNCHRKWRLVEPDPPFKGIWEEIK